MPSLWAQPVMQFETSTHQFGNITEGEIPTFDFVVKNTGTDSLRIIQVVPSCGCTEPQWSKKPIAPNESAVISIGYNSTGRSGVFHKGIQVIANSNPSTHELQIEGEVIPRQIVGGVLSGNLHFSMTNTFLGTVQIGETVRQHLYVQNKGTRPVRIREVSWEHKDNVFVSYPQRPIFAGEVIMIEVALNASDLAAGGFKDTINFKTSDTVMPQKQFVIEATVVE